MSLRDLSGAICATLSSRVRICNGAAGTQRQSMTFAPGPLLLPLAEEAFTKNLCSF